MSDGDPGPAPAPVPGVPPDQPVLLASFPSERPVRELALVLRAKEIAHQVHRTPTGVALLVAARDHAAARREVELYRAENAGWPPRTEVPVAGPLWARATVVYLALLVLFYAFQRGEAFGWSWYDAGLVDGARIRSGEWLRGITALTLHADLVHLLSNMTYGALFGALVAYSLGGGVAWLAILASGALGNLVNAAVHGFEHRSLGASTAVFGAVGVLAGSEVVRRHLLRERRLRRAAPVLVAFLLVSYLGVGNPEARDSRTDVSAHVTGLLVGFALGAPLGLLRDTVTHDRRLQLAAGTLALVLLTAAWVVQLR